MAFLKDQEVAVQLCQGGVDQVLPALLDVFLHHQGNLYFTVSGPDLKNQSKVEKQKSSYI